MSLVNDLLRDLEVRQQPPGTEQHAATAPRAEANSPAVKTVLGIVVVLLLVFAGYWLTLPMPEPLAMPSPKLAAVPLIPSDLPATQSVPVGEWNTDVEPVEPAPVEVEVADSELYDKIQMLLDEARAALAANRLTTPVDDNAYNRYQSVLHMDPSNQAALDGIKNVAARYLALHHSALDNNAPRLAESYLDKAQRVVRHYAAVEEWLSGELERLPLAEKSSTAATKAPEPNVSKANAEHAPRSTVSQAQVVERAQRLMQRSRWAEAEQLLSAFIADHPSRDTGESKTTLFELYLAQGNVTEAERHLQSLTFLPSHRRAYFQARLSVQRGEFEAARALLREYPPAVHVSPEHHALLAGLHHQLGDYENAAGVYRQLLAAMPQQDTYWLGLAVSLDALNDNVGALQAFRYAKLYGKPEAATRAYIDERIAALGR